MHLLAFQIQVCVFDNKMSRPRIDGFSATMLNTVSVSAHQHSLCAHVARISWWAACVWVVWVWEWMRVWEILSACVCCVCVNVCMFMCVHIRVCVCV